jgi:PAS domain S-box-containing protein/putative nucleotidyltransferase with HDIG domain
MTVQSLAKGNMIEDSPIRVLLIDNSPGDVQFIQKMLAQTNAARFELDCVDRLAAGLLRLAANNISVVLLDLDLPDSQGFEAFARAYAQAPRVPIVVMSDLADEELAIKTVQEGAQDYLVKGQITGDLLVRAMRYAIERKRSEEALHSQALIFDNIHDGIIMTDLTGNIMRWNPAAERMFGYYRDEVFCKTLDMLTTRIVNGKLRDGRWAGEMDFTRKDGTDVICETSIIPLCDERGTMTAVCGVSHDITERKQSEEALRKSEEKYRSMIENMHEGYFETDLAGNFTFVNDAVCRLMGYPREELIGKNNRQYTDEKTAKKIYEVYNRIYKTGEPSKGIEQEYIRKDGIKGLAELSVSLISDAEGKPIGFRGISHDITERRQAEEALRESEEKYRLVVENAKETIIITQDLKLVFVNRAAADLVGYSEEILTSQPFTDFIHPDDRNMVVAHHIGRIKGEAVPPVYSFRVLSQDGTVKWVELNAALVRWKERPATLNFLNDITERNQAEEALQRSYDQLRKTFITTVNTLASTVEMRDPYTAGHQRRVTILACAIAEEMGLTEEQFDGLRLAGLVHDIGKFNVPVEILNKPGRITETELNIIKTHPEAGYNALKEIDFPWPVARVVLQHHERLDGSGYPQGLKDGEIMLEARILAVADVVEAMASHRPYRPALGVEAALHEITMNKGILYDPDVTDVCARLFITKGFALGQEI